VEQVVSHTTLQSLNKFGELRWEIDLSGLVGANNSSFTEQLYEYTLTPDSPNTRGIVQTNKSQKKSGHIRYSQIVMGKKYFFVIGTRQPWVDTSLPEAERPKFTEERFFCAVFRYFQDNTPPRLVKVTDLVGPGYAESLATYVGPVGYDVFSPSGVQAYGGVYTDPNNPELSTEHVQINVTTDRDQWVQSYPRNRELHNVFFLTVKGNEDIELKSYYINRREFEEKRAPWGFRLQNIACDGTGRVFWVDKRGKLLMNKAPQQENA
jgi:hypothetical protein